jgi:hypothetical protein
MAIGTDFSISGSGTVTFGYDVDTGDYGFLNEFESDLTIALVAEDSSEDSSSEGSGWRGVAKLTGFAILVDSGAGNDFTAVTGLDDAEFLLLGNGTSATEDDADLQADEATLLETAIGDSDILVTDPAIEAYITNDVVTIWVYDHPGNSPSKIGAVEGDDGDFAAEGDDGDIGTDLDETGGLKIQYHTDPVDVAVGFTTDTDWSATPTGFALSLEIDASFDPFTVSLAAAQGLPSTGTGTTAIGSNVSATFGPATINVGADAEIAGTTEYELGGGLDLAIVDGVDIGVDFIYSSNAAVATDTEITVGLGLVDGLTIDLLAGLYDLLGDGAAITGAVTEDGIMDMRIAFDASYAADAMGGTATVAVGVDMNSVNGNVLADGGSQAIGLDLSLTLADMIPHTEMGLSYASTALSDTFLNAADADGGLVKVWSKVSY